MTAALPVLHKTPSRRHVFISYASADRDAVAELHRFLRDEKLPVWIDNLDVTEGLKAGKPWRDGLAEAVQAALCVVWMASPASIASEWVRAELRRALDLGKRILPYVLDETFTAHPDWETVRAWTTVDGETFGDLQRIMAVKLGDDLARGKLASQLRERVAAARIGGVGFPLGDLEIPISGRDADLTTLETLLRAQRRLVAVLGVGGTGKTRLAAEIAVRQRHFDHGVVWHRIESYTREDDLTAHIRDHLNLPVDTPPDAVWAALGRHSVLLVLDNAEACADIPAYAARLRAYDLSCGARCLLASRAQWDETRLINHAYELAVPDPDAAAQIAADMAAHFGTADRLAGRAAELAEAARRHPRLIQYAAAWLHEHPLPVVLDMLRTLRGGDDMRALLEDVLGRTVTQIESTPRGGQAIADLKKLLVCRGGFTHDAAAALLGDAALDSLALLRRWSLLRLDGERYRPDELAQDGLPADADAAVGRAHYDYYTALAKAHDERQDYAGLDVESANLAAAFDWALAAGDHESAFWLANDCGQFLLNRGRARQFVGWIDAVAAPLLGGDDDALKGAVQNSQGAAYANLAALEDRAENLRRAIACYRAALDYRTSEAAPLDHAMTQTNLGNAYQNLSEVEDRAGNLRRAIACYQAALVYRTPAAAPLDHAQTQNNLGNAYRDLAGLEDRAGNLRRAIACYQAALIYLTPEAAPLDHAMTQNNLGIAYATLAKLEDRAENLRRAIACYGAALVYRTPEAAPLDHAMTQNNLGAAYADLAGLEDRAGNLRRAIDCYRAALVYRTPEAAPLDHAMTQNNLGAAYQNLAALEDRAGNLRRAIACCLAALVYLTPEAAPLDHAATQYNLGNAYRDLSEVEDRGGNLRRAIACYEAALAYLTSEAAPLDHAMTQRNMGIAHEILGDLPSAIACWQVAERGYRRMDAIDKADLMLTWIEDAQRRLK